MKQDAYVYSYKNSAQSFTANCNGYYKMEVYGAQGGTSSYNSSKIGGLGGYTAGIIDLPKSLNLFIFTGQYGQASGSTMFNGGGASTNKSDFGYAGTGGGATDIRVTTGSWNDLNSLKSRIIVAGGGGGADSNLQNGGVGGGLTGGNGLTGYTTVVSTGGTQTSGGTGGTGGQGSATTTTCDYKTVAVSGFPGTFGIGGATRNECDIHYGAYNGGGGGGGYYGGGGGGSWFSSSGAGGSSYVSGCTGADTTYRDYQKINGSYPVFYNVTLSQGVNSGNGYAKIQYLGTSI